MMGADCLANVGWKTFWRPGIGMNKIEHFSLCYGGSGIHLFSSSPGSLNDPNGKGPGQLNCVVFTTSVHENHFEFFILNFLKQEGQQDFDAGSFVQNRYDEADFHGSARDDLELLFQRTQIVDCINIGKRFQQLIRLLIFF